MRTWLLITILCVSLVSSASADGIARFTLHPNSRYFHWLGGPMILITSGEHYGAVLNRAFDYIPYLNELQKHGLNNTRTFSGVYREVPSSFGITDNTLAPKPGDFVCPWARSDQPGESDGGNKFDLTRWNDAYFARLKDFLKAAEERGIVVELDLFCPMYKDEMWLACPMNARNNIQGVGTCSKNEVYALKHEDLTLVQIAFTRKVVEELRGIRNLYYEICNEPYAGGVTMQWQHRIIDVIVETERALQVQPHLISLNIANGRQKVTNPHPAVSIFNFHYCHPPDTVAMNDDLKKPIGENETGFRGKEDVLYRTEGWDFILAGGALYNNLDYSFTASHPAGTLRDYKSPGGGSVELRRQLGILKKFVHELPFTEMKPDPTIVKKSSDNLMAQALVKPGASYAIYFHVPLPGKLKQTPAGKPKQTRDRLKKSMRADVLLSIPNGEYDIEWLDTKTGERAASADVPIWQGDDLHLVSPLFEDDIALEIQRK